MTIDRRWIAAYHESAHAAASAVLREPIYSIKVFDTGAGEFRSSAPTFVPPNWNERQAVDSLCAGWRKDGGPDVEWVKRKCVILLAGPCTNSQLLGGAAAIAVPEDDIYQARSLISTLALSEEPQAAAFEDANERALQLVRRHWHAIGCLAARVYCDEAGEIFERQIRETLELALPIRNALLSEDLRTR